MNCCAYCLASSFPVKKIFQLFQSSYRSTQYREAIHLEIPEEMSESDGIGHAFIFAYGVIVTWNLFLEFERSLIDEILPLAYEKKPKAITEKFTFRYGEKPLIQGDEITLPNKDPLSKLAASHGMAQSVKLESFEHQIEGSFTSTQHIPEELARLGRTSLSRREVRRKMGELFLTRNSITLHVDVLDLPDFFWNYQNLEPLYEVVAVDLDIKNRVEVLNRRLDTVKELFEMLGEEMNHQHSSRLELTIIILIVIEVILTLGEVTHYL